MSYSRALVVKNKFSERRVHILAEAERLFYPLLGHERVISPGGILSGEVYTRHG